MLTNKTRKFISIKTKLTRFIALVFVVTAFISCLSYFFIVQHSSNHYMSLFSNKTLQIMINKGLNLVSNNSFALISMVNDNAFSSVEEFVTSTVISDEDMVAGFFIGGSDSPWVYETDIPLSERYAFLADVNIHRLINSRSLAWQELNVEQYRVFVFNAPVMDGSDYLGTLVYIFSDQSIKAENENIQQFIADLIMKQVLTIILVSGLLLSVAFFTSRKLTSHLVEPLLALTHSAKSISSKNFEQNVSFRNNDEIGQLASQFDTMRATIKDHTKNLETLVDERTRELNHSYLRVKALNAELEQISITDPLTGICNRRKFDEDLVERFQVATDGTSSLALCFCDIDHFKQFNDNYGHQLGDEVIRCVGQTLKACVKSTQLSVQCYRYGGEEFCIMGSKIEAEAFFQFIEQVKQSIQSTAIPFEDKQLNITASYGIFITNQTMTINEAEFVERADKTLYRAKANGRDRIEQDRILITQDTKTTFDQFV